MKTAEDFIRQMESSNIMMAREYTFKEHVTESMQFQDMICKMVAGDEYHEGMRFEEAMFIMEATARRKDVRNLPAVHNGVATMKKLAKEMAITMSGSKGETLVFRTLEFLDRPNTRVFRNVYITDGLEETELDAVVLTDSGVIILEVKKVKSDLTITEDGRMMFAGGECYGKTSLGEKMSRKRRLLKKHLEKAVAEKGWNIPVCVDSLVVFSAPKGQFIHVDDRYHKEKHCFRTGLNKKIEHYLGYAYYKADHMSHLSEILSVMEANARRFAPKMDFDEVRRNLAEAMAVLHNTPEIQEAPSAVHAKIVDLNEVSKSRNAGGFKYAVASAFAGFLLSGAAVLLNKGIGHI